MYLPIAAVRVTSSGEYYLQKSSKDLVFVSLEFPSRVVYNIYASWLAPDKIRKTTIVGSKGMVVFDDVNKTETLKFFDRRIDVGLLHSTPQYSDHQLVVNIGDVSIPAVEQSEPLKNQLLIL
jgi:predicted dehydrogenase